MSFGSETIERQSMIERSGHSFPHPFFDVASQYMPRHIKDAFKWAEWMYFKYGAYKSATDRIVRYGITTLQLGDERTETTEKYEELLEKKLHIKTRAIESNTDLLVYGNNFTSLYFPFDRFLLCPSCGLERKIKEVRYKFTNFEFVAKCPCGFKGIHKHRDKRSIDPSRVKIIRWSPHEIDIKAHPISGEKEFYWQIPSDFAKKIELGEEFYINSTPWVMIKCIKDKKMFRFAPGQLHHRTLSTLAGFSKDWGIPPCMSVFTLYWYTAVLRRMNEAIAFDFIVPFRVIFPQGSSNNNDPTNFINLGNFVSKMSAMVRNHRRDPAHVQIAPIPIGYQAVGGEGKALDTSELVKATTDEILNSLGYPAELFYGTLSIQALPAALRLFENTWRDLKDNVDDWIQWVANKSGEYFDWDDIEASFTAVTLADDIERRQVVMQFAASQQISNMTALKQWGIDFKEEQEKKIEEQQITQEMATKSQEVAKETQQVNAGTGPEDSGGSSIYDVQGNAQAMAQQMLAMDETTRRQQLQQISQTDETLYSLVKMYMERIRSQMQSQTGQQALQQGLMVTGAGGVTGGGLGQQGGAPVQ